MPNKKISDLPNASPFTGLERQEAVQGGVNVQFGPAEYAPALKVLLNNWRGGFDASANVFPSSGGTGTGGVPDAGNEWYITVGGAPNGFTLNPGARITALVNNPGNTQANWLITNN